MTTNRFPEGEQLTTRLLMNVFRGALKGLPTKVASERSWAVLTLEHEDCELTVRAIPAGSSAAHLRWSVRQNSINPEARTFLVDLVTMIVDDLEDIGVTVRTPHARA